jgi:hypothetical protein
VEHVLPVAGLEDLEQFRGEPAPQRVSAEGPQGHGQEARQRAQDDEESSRRPGSYSTVTDLARLRGWSTSQPRRTAMW